MSAVLSAIILGAVQGLTEFLPVSSSGHLVLLQSFLGWNNQETNLFFDIVLHASTLVAVLLVLRRPLFQLIAAAGKYQFRGFYLLAVGTIPAVLAILLFSQLITSLFSAGWLLSFAFLVSAIWLIISRQLDKPRLTGRWLDLSYRQAILIGCFQGLALVPGISRSGSTYLAGLLSRLTPHQSYTFSFLLAIPAIIGALTYQLIDLPSNLSIASSVWFAGSTTALVFGVLGLKLWDTIIIKRQYWILTTYLIILAVVNLVVIYK